MVASERSNSDLSEYTPFQIKNRCIDKNQFLGEKWKIFFVFAVLIILLPKFSDFINSDDCMGKITSKSVRLYPVFNQKKDINLIKIGIISSEKVRNSGY